MRSQILAAAATLAVPAVSLNILLGNDDGFGSAQIRETYRLLKQFGHNVVMVAPVDNESGQGGRSSFTSSPTLYSPSEYNLIPAGAPSVGQDPMDSHIWYYNGTPAACTFVGLDYVLPQHFPHFKLDLAVNGPNFGLNLGNFLYTLSGTMGATYAAIGRGVPAIAFSGGNSAQYSYQNITASKNTATKLADPATIQAQLAVKIVNQIAKTAKAGKPIFPLAHGVSVNTPYITSLTNKSCVAPDFIQTRLSGGGFSDSAVYSNGVCDYANNVGSGINAYINGNPNLPGETPVVNGGCHASVSVFTVDYDAPRGDSQSAIRSSLNPVVTYKNGILGKRDLELNMPSAADAPLRHQ